MVLAVLLARKIWQLVRDYRDHVPGSRLTARTVIDLRRAGRSCRCWSSTCSRSAFLNRGIDSWFRVEVKQGLGDALVLSRSALDLRMREQGRRTEEFAQSLAEPTGDAELAELLDAERRVPGAARSSCSAATARCSPRAARRARSLLDAQLPPELLLQVRDNRPYSSLEPLDAAAT